PFATGGIVALTTSGSTNGATPHASATSSTSSTSSKSSSVAAPVKNTPPGQAKKTAPTPTPTPIILPTLPPIFPTPTPTPAPTPTPVPEGNLTTQPVNSSSDQILWTLPGNAARVQIFRNGRLIDDFPFPGGAGMVYTDYLLWQSTTYAYEVKLLDGGN